MQLVRGGHSTSLNKGSDPSLGHPWDRRRVQLSRLRGPDARRRRPYTMGATRVPRMRRSTFESGPETESTRSAAQQLPGQGCFCADPRARRRNGTMNAMTDALASRGPRQAQESAFSRPDAPHAGRAHPRRRGSGPARRKPDPNGQSPGSRGLQGARRPYFGYAIPSGWKENTSYSDDTRTCTTTARTAGSARTSRSKKCRPGQDSWRRRGGVIWRIRAGGVPAHRRAPSEGPGATFAYEYSVTRAGTVDAIAIDAWDANTQTELWLLVHAPAGVAQAVLSSLTTV